MAILSSIPSGLYFLGVFLFCGVLVHFRGRVRHRLLRQLFDHSTFLAPINCFIYLFSKIPARPYCDVQDFPEMEILRNNYQLIRDEALALNADAKIAASDALDDIGFNSFFRTGWRRYYLKWYGTELKSALRDCPKTTALLSQIPSIKAAMFASLPPGATLVKHRDPFAGSLRYHLGLECPGHADCAIYVDGEPYIWRNGEDVIFDETFIHYAQNKTQQQRIVLFCDLERPLWFLPATWFSRLFGRVVLGSAVSKNERGDKVGLLNRVFSHVYKIRELGKRIKNKNRRVYYVLKYVLFAVLVYLIFF
jgi:beta-hydroxylase